ncbi:hypothetical protein B0A50_00794 [Salinomyces thailandicus]|uniref:Succinate dehydrogenase [ubiquinone] cytochrome b small subunit n=1 Tax=Salinomyces thailandicus TaxID=706561 RepID=A0A4U0UCK9_9PEZI|nr:hypothetical protein B0A50_00794 [Salinomyces thailandica]
MATSALRPALRQAFAAPTARSVLPALRYQSLAQRSPILTQSSGFQTSSRRQILPPLPQKIQGTVNDAAVHPEPHPQHGSYHWSMERLVSIGILPLTVAPFAAGSLSPLLDGAFISLLIVHTYMGFGNIITDYLPKWRVPRWRMFFDYANLLAVFVVGWGWYEFETNDVGLTEAVKRIWRASSEKKSI